MEESVHCPACGEGYPAGGTWAQIMTDGVEYLRKQERDRIADELPRIIMEEFMFVVTSPLYDLNENPQGAFEAAARLTAKRIRTLS